MHHNRPVTAAILSLLLCQIAWGLPGILEGPVINPANGNTYYLLESSTWTEAQTVAEQLGGNLTTINDGAENEWVYTTFSDVAYDRGGLWIGLYDKLGDNQFVWVSGQPVTYTNWSDAYPDFTSEDYTVMWKVAGWEGAWNNTLDDNWGDHITYGVVEVETQGILAYHVDGANGNDSNIGTTHETAFATIGRGIEAAEEGDTVLVWPGVYSEMVDFAGKGITIRSAGHPAVIENPGNFAVACYSGEGPGSVLEHFVIRNSDTGIFLLGSSPTINHVTVVDNSDYGVWASPDSEPAISNSIFSNNGENLVGCEAQYSWTETTPPAFGDAEGGNFHLQSQHGRYVSVDPAIYGVEGLWAMDELTSPAIDGGNPAANPMDEPMPNGGRVNLGAYGNTAYASRSPWPVPGDVNQDGAVDLNDMAIVGNDWLWQAEWVQ